ncbi:response regulator transcription factor [Marinoscillum sp. MHG1-6]|uniref:response regulator transcription factor n=1 Tax=Marinoscillum sp. MHG1-6 TaxID=2959627 RepID=UPI0021576418|nr:response regulator transcription factor [Marinoscillum sp. MHG1-6]
MRKVSVVLSDFQFLTREGLIHMVENNSDFSLAGVNEGPEGLLEMILDKHPDVLLLDYQSQDPILLTLLKQILQSHATNVLIITNDTQKASIQNLLKLGVKGIVTKGCSKLEIVNAIHSVSKGSRFFCNKVLDLVMTPEEPRVEDCLPTELSPRENEVLQLITKGFKTSDIADHLNVSVHTINSHRKNILKKLNLKSPTELIVFAMESGLVKS